MTPWSPASMKRPCGCTTTGISRQFGSMEHFKSCFKEDATSANQNTPDLCRTVPLLAIDVWEHAYSLTEMLVSQDRLPCQLRTSLLNNAGGVFNHRFFFEGMTKAGTRVQAPALFRQITKQFGSMEHFKSCFKEDALSVFGSGYAWLV